jgi:hypothetical protein
MRCTSYQAPNSELSGSNNGNQGKSAMTTQNLLPASVASALKTAYEQL